MPRANSTNWSVGDPVTAARLQDLNLDIDELFANGDDRGRVQLAVSETPLCVDIAPFVFHVGSTIGVSAGETDLLLDDDATSYIEVNSGGTISVSTSGFDSQKAPLAIVVTSGGDITSISIKKADVIGGDLSGGIGGFLAVSDMVYDVNGLLQTFTADGLNYEITRNPDGSVAEVTDGSVTVTILRNSWGRVTGTSVA